MSAIGPGLGDWEITTHRKSSKSVLVNRIMNTELGEFHRRDTEDAEFSDYFSALSAPRR